MIPGFPRLPDELRPVAFLAAGLLVADQLNQAGVGAEGFDPGVALWRVQQSLVFANRGPLFFAASVVVAFGLLPTKSARWARAWAVLQLVTGLAFVALALILVRDAPEVRYLATASEVGQFAPQVLRSLGSAGATAAAFLLAATFTLRNAGSSSELEGERLSRP
jgi:hypothetical protein